MAEVYILKFPSGKGYVGRTKKTAESRFHDHAEAARKGSRCAVHRAIRKYGVDYVCIEVLAQGISWAESAEVESECIARLGTLAPNGYNMTAGGEGLLNWTPSPETRQLWSDIRRGRPLSEETKIKMSQVRRGRRKSEEHRQKISETKRRQAQEKRDARDTSSQRSPNAPRGDVPAQTLGHSPRE